MAPKVAAEGIPAEETGSKDQTPLEPNPWGDLVQNFINEDSGIEQSAVPAADAPKEGKDEVAEKVIEPSPPDEVAAKPEEKTDEAKPTVVKTPTEVVKQAEVPSKPEKEEEKPSEPIKADETKPPEEPPAVVEPLPKPEPTAEERAKTYSDLREKSRQDLLTRYRLSTDMVTKLGVDTAETLQELLPQMAAEMYLDLFEGIWSTMTSQLPNLVQGQLQVGKDEQSKKDVFYGAWPQLNKPEYEDTINRVASSYRSLYPSASRDEFIKEVGAQAWVALRLPIGELVALTGGTVESPSSQPAVSSHQPANPGGSKPTLVKKDENPYTKLSIEFDEEDAS